MVEYTLIGLSTEDVEDTVEYCMGISDAEKQKILDYVKNNEQSFMGELEHYMSKYFADSVMEQYREDIFAFVQNKLEEID